MPEVKKILISVPETLLQEVDNLVSCENLSRSRLIQRAVMFYIKEQKKAQRLEQMKNGYREMADINLSLAEICFQADCQQAESYEEKLAECD